MAKAPVVEEHDLRRMLKIAAVTGVSPLRDVALLYVLYGTGAMLTELAQLKVTDYLTEAGRVRRDSAIRAEIAHNNVERPVFWVNAKVVAAVEAYLAFRASSGQGVSDTQGGVSLTRSGELSFSPGRRGAVWVDRTALGEWCRQLFV